jgi:hypothetical protein
VASAVSKDALGAVEEESTENQYEPIHTEPPKNKFSPQAMGKYAKAIPQLGFRLGRENRPFRKFDFQSAE